MQLIENKQREAVLIADSFGFLKNFAISDTRPEASELAPRRLTGAGASRNLKAPEKYGSVRRNRADAARRAARSAGDDRAYQRLDPELRKLADAGARRRLDCRARSGGGCVEAEVWAAAKEVMQQEMPRKMTFNLNNEAAYDTGLICGGTLEIFVEPILPQPKLYIFGGGHVSMALAHVAHLAGFANRRDRRPRSFANTRAVPDGRGDSHQLRRSV